MANLHTGSQHFDAQCVVRLYSVEDDRKRPFRQIFFSLRRKFVQYGMAKFRTHYDNLKVAHNAPDAVIRAAYKTLMQQYHPDKFEGGKDEALRIVKIVKHSYEVLIDPVKRKEHNEWIDAQNRRQVETERGKTGGFGWHDQAARQVLSENEMYEIIAEEMASGKTQKGVMAKAMVESGGDPGKSTARYIKLRLQKLKAEQQKASKTQKKHADYEEYYLAELAALGCRITPQHLGACKKWLVITKRGEAYEIRRLDEFKALHDRLKRSSQLRLPVLALKKQEYIVLVIVILITAGVNILLY